MGEKGARQTQAGAAMAGRLVDELAPLGDVTSKKMFGGFGVFADGVMFALVDSAGGAFLRAGDSGADAFEAAGSARHARMPYWSVPGDVIDDDGRLLDWARQALAVAQAAKR